MCFFTLYRVLYTEVIPRYLKTPTNPIQIYLLIMKLDNATN